MTSDDHHLKFKEHCKEKLKRHRNSTGLQSLHKKKKKKGFVRYNKLQKQSTVLCTTRLSCFKLQFCHKKTTNTLPTFSFALLKGYARIRIQMVLLGHNIKPWHLE